MTKTVLSKSITTLFCSFLLIALFSATSWAQSSDNLYIIDADSIHIGTGEVLYNGRILVNNGIIRAVGAQSEIEIPSGATRLEAQVVTPGFIDAHTVVGLAGYLNDPGNDQDQLDRSSAIQPELRALDAYNPAEPLVTHLRNHGVTTIQTGHAPGALISGQSLIIKTNAQQAASFGTSVNAYFFIGRRNQWGVFKTRYPSQIYGHDTATTNQGTRLC
jgi:hypothetical protein